MAHFYGGGGSRVQKQGDGPPVGTALSTQLLLHWAVGWMCMGHWGLLLLIPLWLVKSEVIANVLEPLGLLLVGRMVVD